MKIIDAIQNVAKHQKSFKTSDVTCLLKNRFSRQAVHAKLSKMVQLGELVKRGSARWTLYALPQNAEALIEFTHRRFKNEHLNEDEVLAKIKIQKQFLSKLPTRLDSIFSYAFLEMLNNAIEHSKSKFIETEINEHEGNLFFRVRDFGIGVFRNVMKRRKLNSEAEAIQDLLKGKTTTAPKIHSGEGIFFTSKVADIFTLESFGYRLTVNNLIRDVFLEEIPSRKGTNVGFWIALNSKKQLEKTFKEYQTDSETYAFDKTSIKIKLYTLGTVYISRSQARRVLTGLEKFKSIILDFSQVSTIGQAFADEVFRVFKLKHPEIEVTPINMQEGVRFMVERVEKI